ncbi:hypothetical protein EDB83DRAFT_494832 [Lactarius deliciosus]|nr:hypothetical protein EDB83DRAFT_494832 [Lactarius deliciosus]
MSTTLALETRRIKTSFLTSFTGIVQSVVAATSHCSCEVEQKCVRTMVSCSVTNTSRKGNSNAFCFCLRDPFQWLSLFLSLLTVRDFVQFGYFHEALKVPVPAELPCTLQSTACARVVPLRLAKRCCIIRAVRLLPKFRQYPMITD